MNDDKTSVKVKIFGNEYSFKGPETEDHIRKVCAYVDDKIREVSKNNPDFSPFNLAIMTSVNISDDLHKKIEQSDNIENQINGFNDIVSELNGKLNILEKENEYLRQVIESLNDQIKEYEK